MGLFSSKKTTYVSSAIYNLAGDIWTRPSYRKTMVLGHVRSNPKKTLTEDVIDSYLEGPGINIRRFGLWARNSGYNNAIGLGTSTIAGPGNIDPATLAAQLTSIFGKPVYVNEARIGTADYGMWAAQWMLANYPALYNGNTWSADFDEDTGEMLINIRGMQQFRVVPAGFLRNTRYMYVSMNQEINPPSSSVIGDWKDGSGPSTVGYKKIYDIPETEVVNLTCTTTIVQTEPGKDPVTNTFDVPTSPTVSLKYQQYQKSVKLPDPVNTLVIGDVTTTISLRERYEIVTLNSTETLVEDINGVERTSVVTKAEQVIKKITQYKVVTVTIRERAWSNEQIFIYREGTGYPVFDGYFSDPSNMSPFFPMIPVRIDNQFVSESAYAHLLPWVQQATRRATDVTFEKIRDIVANNPSLGDIDYAYMVFGTSLNSPENAAKRYMYEFFREVGSGSAAMNAYWVNYGVAQASWDAWTRWYTSGRYTNSSEPEPYRHPIPSLPRQSIQVVSGQNYNVVINFSAVTETIHAGNYSGSAELGDLRVYRGVSQRTVAYDEQDYEGNIYQRMGTEPVQSIIFEWQFAENTFRRLEIVDLVHTNWIYGGKSVVISGWDALLDGEESGFVIPLNEALLRNLPLTVTTQLTTATNYIMFNCYQVVKQKWYQTGIFRVVLVIVVIVISVYTGGAGAATAGGMLGSNAVVGATLGFAGTAAIVAGAMANAIAAMIVTQVLSSASTKVFGEQLGGVIGAIASIITISVGSQMAGGQPISASFGNMLNAENLMQLTSALGDGITNYINTSTADIQNQTKDVLEDYREQSLELSQKFIDEFGDGTVDILKATSAFSFRMEDPAIFMSRTLMTGTDIADLSFDMLDNFADLTVALPLE